MTANRVLCLLAAAALLQGPLARAQNQPMPATAVGTESREDDWPSIAAAPDGSVWASWLSFSGDRDDVALRRFHNGVWLNLQWVPATSGDSLMPQVGVDARNRVWVVWSQQAAGNWDVYARRFDPQLQQWSEAERFSDHPQPDINPRMATDAKGRFALVWQGFRDGVSQVFLKAFDGERWQAAARVTRAPTNHWEPAAALDGSSVWVAYDSYRNGSYDVFVTRVPDGKAPEPEMPVAATAAFESRASVAVDTAGRVWVAWEQGKPGWGKDQGYVIRDRQPGAVLGGSREAAIRCWDGGRWRQPEADLMKAFPSRQVYQPHVFSDGKGSVRVAAKLWNTVATGQVRPQLGYFEYWLTHFNGTAWAPGAALPHSKGRSSTRMSGALDAEGALRLIWPTDGRTEPYYHRPRRQQVFTAKLDSPRGRAPVWGEAAPAARETAPAGHENEPADIAAIRAYRATLGGRQHRIVRGDFHRHTELSWDGSGGNDGSLQDFYRYMLDAAAMDFGASTDHQGGYWPYWWWYTQKMTDMYNVSGAYAAVFGYERSVGYPNGHRNVFFANRSDSRVTPFFVKNGLRGFELPLGPVGEEPTVNTSAPDAVVANDTKLLWEELRARGAISIPHTLGTRQGVNWADADAAIEPVVEIFQGCRTSYEAVGAPLTAQLPKDAAHIQQAGVQPDGMLSNGLAKGYRLGIIASSDHSSTHISYAMVYTDDFSRKGILDAIRKRHTYGAMDNIILDVRMGEHFMGDEFTLQAATPIRVIARGTKPLARVDVIKDNQVVYSKQPNSRQVEFEFLDQQPLTGSHFYYVRVQQVDEMLAWSSPLFVNR